MSTARDLPRGMPSSIYERLRHDIISMTVSPGSDLDERRLVEKYGVSRTPVREALIRLAAEGLVEIRKNRGATVTSLDLDTLQSIFEAGDLIERAFTRLACLRRDAADLREIKQIKETFEDDLTRKDISAMVDSNSRFHLRIAEASGNKYFADCYRRILADHERIAQVWYSRNIQQQNDLASRLIIKQHDQLYAAIRNRDAEAAETVSMDHAALCKEGVRATLIDGESLIADLTIDPKPFMNW